MVSGQLLKTCTNPMHTQGDLTSAWPYLRGFHDFNYGLRCMSCIQLCTKPSDMTVATFPWVRRLSSDPHPFGFSRLRLDKPHPSHTKIDCKLPCMVCAIAQTLSVRSQVNVGPSVLSLCLQDLCLALEGYATHFHTTLGRELSALVACLVQAPHVVTSGSGQTPGFGRLDIVTLVNASS